MEKITENNIATKIRTMVKLNFGVGASVVQMQEWIFNVVLFFYYVNIIGLSGTYTGIATFITLIFDGVSDPLIGSISDRWKSKLGRRHPFMYLGAFPLSICFALLFIPPGTSQELSQLFLFLWFLIFSTGVKLGMTLFAVPHIAFGAELSSDYMERSKVMSFHAVFSGIGGVTAGILAFGIYFKETVEYKNGLLNVEQYPKFAITIAILMFLIIYYSAFFTRKEALRLSTAHEGTAKFNFSEFLKDIQTALKNPNYLFMLLGMLFLLMGLGVNDAISLFLNSYFWELAPAQLMGLALAVLIGVLLAFIITPFLHQWIGKRDTLLFAVVCFTAQVIPVLLRVTGFFVPNRHPLLFPIIFCGTVLVIMAIYVANISAFSMIADITDENELETGRRQEGIFYSTRTLSSKFTVGFGHLLGGLALDHIILFPKGGKEVAQIGAVDADVLWRMGLFVVCMIILCNLLAFIFYKKYAITKEKYEETRNKLAGRA